MLAKLEIWEAGDLPGAPRAPSKQTINGDERPETELHPGKERTLND